MKHDALAGQNWPKVRAYARDYFKFWPDGEDLLWAKHVWPAIEPYDLFWGEGGEEEEAEDARIRSLFFVLSVIYAESACHFGLTDFEGNDHLTDIWITTNFGSEDKFDECLFEVHRAIMDYFDGDDDVSGVLLPLIRSLVTGGAGERQDTDLEAYLSRISETNFVITSYHEDQLRRLWVGNHFNRKALHCIT